MTYVERDMMMCCGQDLGMVLMPNVPLSVEIRAWYSIKDVGRMSLDSNENCYAFALLACSWANPGQSPSLLGICAEQKLERGLQASDFPFQFQKPKSFVLVV